MGRCFGSRRPPKQPSYASAQPTQTAAICVRATNPTSRHMRPCNQPTNESKPSMSFPSFGVCSTTTTEGQTATNNKQQPFTRNRTTKNDLYARPRLRPPLRSATTQLYPPLPLAPPLQWFHYTKYMRIRTLSRIIAAVAASAASAAAARRLSGVSLL